MRLIEMTDEEHAILTRLANTSTLNPPSPSSSDSVIAANTLALRMLDHLNDAEEIADLPFIERLFYYFPELKEFDVKTDERALFAECLEALIRQLPQSLKQEPLVVGSYLLRIMDSPDSAGFLISQAWELGDGGTKR